MTSQSNHVHVPPESRPSPRSAGLPSQRTQCALRVALEDALCDTGSPFVVVARAALSALPPLPSGTPIVALDGERARLHFAGVQEVRRVESGRPQRIAGWTLALASVDDAYEPTVFDRSAWTACELRVRRNGEQRPYLSCRLSDEIDAALIVGRGASGVDLALEDDYVSRRHARFFVRDGESFVEDIGSKGGTVVNERRIEAPTRLQHGDVVRLGDTTLELYSFAEVMRGHEAVPITHDKTKGDATEARETPSVALPASEPGRRWCDSEIVLAGGALTTTAALLAFYIWRSVAS